MVVNNLGGPHGLGDPNDRTLRKVEIEVMIPKVMRDRAKVVKCIDEVKDFETCCKSSGLMMWYKCRKENTALKDCYTKWYSNDEFKAECTEIYLQERSEFRRTGISKKRREYMAAQGQA